MDQSRVCDCPGLLYCSDTHYHYYRRVRLLQLIINYPFHFHRVLDYTSGQVATLPVHLIFAMVSACGLQFSALRIEPQLGLRPRYTSLQRSR